MTRFIAFAFAGMLVGCQNGAAERFNAFPATGIASGTAFCSAWAVAQCGWLQRCAPASHAGDERNGGCAAAQERTCLVAHARALAAEELGQARVNGRVAQACVNRWGVRQCGDPEPQVCDGVWLGLGPAMTACTVDEQCVPGLLCSAACGRCAAPGTFGCAGDSDCAPGDRCAGTACVLARLMGERCEDAPSQCADGLVCVGIPGLMACAAPVVEGASCADDLCAEGLVCANTDSGQWCRRWAEAGEACGNVACRGDNTALWCNAGVCSPVNVVMTGEACGQGGAVCSSADRCAGGVCVARARAGGACDADETCFQARCEDGVCVSPSVSGEACTDRCEGLACRAGRCSLAACVPGPVFRDAGVP